MCTRRGETSLFISLNIHESFSPRFLNEMKFLNNKMRLIEIYLRSYSDFWGWLEFGVQCSGFDGFLVSKNNPIGFRRLEKLKVSPGVS